MSNKNNAIKVAEFENKIAEHKQKMVEQGDYFFISHEPDGFTINTDNKEAREDIFKLIFSYVADKEIQAVSFESAPTEIN
jgi:hypothetical protein